jgi:hypothetical protein
VLFGNTNGRQDCARQRVRNVAGVCNFHIAAILVVAVLGVCLINALICIRSRGGSGFYC